MKTKIVYRFFPFLTYLYMVYLSYLVQDEYLV